MLATSIGIFWVVVKYILEASVLISSTCGIQGSLSSLCCPFFIIVIASPSSPFEDHGFGTGDCLTVEPNLSDCPHLPWYIKSPANGWRFLIADPSSNLSLNVFPNSISVPLSLILLTEPAVVCS